MSAPFYSGMIGLTLLGSGWAVLALFPLYAVPSLRRFTRWLGALWGLTAALVFALKAIVQRPRPLGPAVWGAMPTDYSCPSGHAAGAFAFAGFVAVLLLDERSRRRQPWRWALAGATLTVAAGIAASRVYLGVHHLEDVVAGAMVGGCAGVLAAWMYRKDGRTAPPDVQATQPRFGKGLAVPGVRDPQ